MEVPVPGPIETPGVDTKPGLLTEIRRTFRLRGDEIKHLLSLAVSNWFRHNVPRLGASLAFYTMLSLAPLLVIVIAVAGFFFGREAAQGQIVWQIQDLVGRDGAEAIQTMIRGAQRPSTGTIATVLGLATLIFGATSVVAELRSALNTVWCVPYKEESGIRSLVTVLRDRGLALGLVLGIGFLLLVSLAFNAAVSALGHKLHRFIATPEWLLRIVDFTVSWVVIALLFAVLYKYLPDLYIEWRDVALGALVTSLLFSVGKSLIGIYLGTAGIGTTYGAAGSLVIILVWVYYSAQIFFLGAELTLAYAQTFGSRPCDRVGKEVKIVSSMSATAEEENPQPEDTDSRPLISLQ